MARRASNKIQPATMTITLASPSVTGGQTGRSYIDLSQCLSLANRRFYRQGLNWAVAGFKVSSLQPGTVSIGKLPNTWVVSNAWEKAMRTWLKQQNDAIEEAGLESGVAAFRDFKIHADATHVNAGFSANLLPFDIAGNAYAAGEWDASLVVVPNAGGVAGNTQEYYLNMVGDDDPAPVQSKGIIKAYAESRGVPQSPDPVTLPGAEDSLFVQMFDKGMEQEDVVDNAIDRNDNLPYPQLDYPGGDTQAPSLEYHDFVTVFETNATNGVGIQRLKGGNFPCGLIAVDWSPVSSANVVIQIDLVPGHHRGYLAESMVEM